MTTLTKSLFTLFILLSIQFSMAQSFKEKIALYELYQATNGAQWKYQWDLENPISQWKGVTVEDDKVVGIDLTGFKLDGEIPKTFHLLTHLQTLNLSDNSISGSLPKEIVALKNLKVLDLGNNLLTGEIPEDIALLENLETLDLSRNQITGKLPKRLGSIKSLKILDVAFNQIEGNIPFEIGNLKNLREFAIQFNQLSGHLPTSFSKLKKLRILQLSNNDFSSYEGLSGLQPKQLIKFDLHDALPQYKLLKTAETTRVADIKFEDKNR